MIIDGIDPARVRGAMSMLPSFFGFRFIPEDSGKYTTVKDGGDWDGQVYLNENMDYGIIFFDGASQGYAFGGHASITDRTTHRIGVNVAGCADVYALYNRTYHELIHTTLQDYRADRLWSDAAFFSYLPGSMKSAFIDDRDAGFVNSTRWEPLFYDFLLLEKIEY